MTSGCAYERLPEPMARRAADDPGGADVVVSSATPEQ
jgi:hypothetical protein